MDRDGRRHMGFNGGSTAFDGQSVLGTTALNAFALDRSSGDARWIAPQPDGFPHFQGTAVAGGVVYHQDDEGALVAYDAATGTPILRRYPALDAGMSPITFAQSSYGSFGVTIAEHAVFVTTQVLDANNDADAVLVAYGLDQ